MSLSRALVPLRCGNHKAVVQADRQRHLSRGSGKQLMLGRSWVGLHLSAELPPGTRGLDQMKVAPRRVTTARYQLVWDSHQRLKHKPLLPVDQALAARHRSLQFHPQRNRSRTSSGGVPHSLLTRAAFARIQPVNLMRIVLS